MAGRNWLAICAIGGGLLGGALGVALGDIFGGVAGGLMLGGVIGLAVRGKSPTSRQQGTGQPATGLHDPFPHHLGIGAAGLMAAHHTPASETSADATCAVDSGTSFDMGAGADCGGGGGDSGGGN
ncbi:hypothetical protein [Brevundimonas subvibrioides]|uniref:Uncharacterized protein n=1 Tax=Brevundimonas subvibrioides (strain ATCC 15264 / DSM 4735 / LMG 14903 / NBRC 16000 / CB 81) TaxID=633149 RepID=D9QN92_BRESC|nr:hypothetical protein [Brevundimonas subvibrioides]ADL00293.1 conserved hypothetical protein [Brevundimonas subvibrioides ATCC 15264]